jgi:uncharacterized protein YcfJ
MKNLLIAAAGLVFLAGCQTTVQQPARILHPVEKCGYVNKPVYGVLDRPASDGEVLGGAVIGGVIGDAVGDNGAATVMGAIIGGAIASNQRKQERVVVGSERVWQCQTVYE